MTKIDCVVNRRHCEQQSKIQTHLKFLNQVDVSEIQSKLYIQCIKYSTIVKTAGKWCFLTLGICQMRLEIVFHFLLSEPCGKWHRWWWICPCNVFRNLLDYYDYNDAMTWTRFPHCCLLWGNPPFTCEFPSYWPSDGVICFFADVSLVTLLNKQFIYGDSKCHDARLTSL